MLTTEEKIELVKRYAKRFDFIHGPYEGEDGDVALIACTNPSTCEIELQVTKTNPNGDVVPEELCAYFGEGTAPCGQDGGWALVNRAHVELAISSGVRFDSYDIEGYASVYEGKWMTAANKANLAKAQ